MCLLPFLYAVNMGSLSKIELLCSLLHINVLSVSGNFQLQVWHSKYETEDFFQELGMSSSYLIWRTTLLFQKFPVSEQASLPFLVE